MEEPARPLLHAHTDKPLHGSSFRRVGAIFVPESRARVLRRAGVGARGLSPPAAPAAASAARRHKMHRRNLAFRRMDTLRIDKYSLYAYNGCMEVISCKKIKRVSGRKAD